MEFLEVPLNYTATLQTFSSDEIYQIAHTGRVAPFVVIPAHDLNGGSADHSGGERIEN